MGLRRFLRSKDGGEDKYENEIKSIVSEGADTGELEETEARMIERVFELDDPQGGNEGHRG